MRILYAELSDESLVEDAEWSVSVVFFDTESMWVLPYRGLVAVPDQAQAIW